MHSAPAVNYPAGRALLAGIAVLALWSAGALAVAAWVAQAPAGSVVIAFAVASVLAAGALTGRAWLRSTTGMLAWDGESWTLATADGTHAGTPEVALDAQRLLLLRWRAAGRGGCWLWLERGTLPAR